MHCVLYAYDQVKFELFVGLEVQMIIYIYMRILHASF